MRLETSLELLFSIKDIAQELKAHSFGNEKIGPKTVSILLDHICNNVDVLRAHVRVMYRNNETMLSVLEFVQPLVASHSDVSAARLEEVFVNVRHAIDSVKQYSK